MITTENRKRKQDVVTTNVWSDFIYSTPSSPSTDLNQFNFDTLFDHHQNLSGTNSRRHSVAVGEVDYHSLDNTIDFNQLFPIDDDHNRPLHKRTLSLRDDNPNYAALLSPSLLLDTNDSLLSDLINHNFTNDFITPSVITNEINSMANWLLEQDVKSKRQKTDSLSPIDSSLPSSSPSPPPITTSFVEPIMNDVIQSNVSLKPLIQDYLSNPSKNERTVMLLTSRVAQKSYGTEKRFLCPPPTTILKGANWWSDTSNNKKSLFYQSAPKLTIHISGETINQTGILEWQTSNGTIIDPSTVASSSSISGRCVSKQLYINDADEKRKRVEVLAKIQLGNGVHLGTFPSKGIKVISKPSKKRQSIKNMELCINHGTTISLFNRIRSQTVSTKYLGVSNGDKNNNGTCFVARTGSWDPFVIWIVDTKHSPDTHRQQYLHHPNNPDFPPPPAIALQTNTLQTIHYNQPVVLQCVTTGLVSPVMIVRKVDKTSMAMGGNRIDSFEGIQAVGGECGDETLGDPVSQLHKVAFQIVQDPSFTAANKVKTSNGLNTEFQLPQSYHPVTYLACLNDVVGMHKTTFTRHVIQSPNLNDLMQGTFEDNKKPARRRMSSLSNVSETKGRRGSTDSFGLEGACWTEDVTDAAVWTIVGTDCASYTFWTPTDMPVNTITPYPVLTNMAIKDNVITVTGENLSRDICVWFGDIQSQTEYKSKDSIICRIPDMQELLNSPTLIHQEQTRKLPLLFVRNDGFVYRTNQFYVF